MRKVWIEVLNLVYCVFFLGSVVAAAPHAQPETTSNAQKAFVQLRILLGSFHIRVRYLCALPVPLSEKVHVLRPFLRVCFGHRFGSQIGAQRVPFGGHLGHPFGVF